MIVSGGVVGEGSTPGSKPDSIIVESSSSNILITDTSDEHATKNNNIKYKITPLLII